MLKRIGSLFAMVAACAGIDASAGVMLETVTVGSAGNGGEWSGESYGGSGPDRLCGAVDYAYGIGKYEVTAGQYCAFLNAVAAADPYDLYDERMDIDSGLPLAFQGCNIRRSGLPGGYSYSVPQDWADRPVNFVSWGDAARFSNWLHNGQPTGAQGPGTTEDGAYRLDGATSNEELLAVAREPGATWAIPSEDEWYKAAYHYNDGATANYFDYPTSSDTLPSNALVEPDPGNNATFLVSGYTIGPPYHRTQVGAHENSASPCGSFDQGGNVWEWNEAVLASGSRGLRGGSFHAVGDALHAAHRAGTWPSSHEPNVGFRVCLVPEPASVAVLTLVGLGLLRRR